MRDHLVDFSGRIADIEEVREIDRRTDADGVVCIVNAWRVRQQMPAMVRSVLKTDEISWIDRNTWDSGTYTCAWTIEPDFLTEHIACSGRTSFTTAMGGQGTRVIFEGELDIDQSVLHGALGSAERLLAGSIESIVATAIPHNLRGVVEAAADFEVPR